MKTLGEDIILLAIQPGGRLAEPGRLGYALAGSELVRLAVLRRIDVKHDRVTVLDNRPLEDRNLDDALRSIAGATRAVHASAWVRRPRARIVETYLMDLEAAGVVVRERRNVLLVFPVSRWRVRDAARLAEVRERLDRIARSEGEVDARSAAFAGLVHAVGLSRVLYPDTSRENAAAWARLKEIAEQDRTGVARFGRGREGSRGTDYAPSDPWVNGAIQDSARGAADTAQAGAMDAAAAAATGAALDAAVHAATDAAIAASVDAAVHASIDAAVTASIDATQHASTHHGGFDGGGHHGGGHHGGFDGGGGGHH